MDNSFGLLVDGALLGVALALIAIGFRVFKLIFSKSKESIYLYKIKNDMSLVVDGRNHDVLKRQKIKRSNMLVNLTYSDGDFYPVENVTEVNWLHEDSNIREPSVLVRSDIDFTEFVMPLRKIRNLDIITQA